MSDFVKKEIEKINKIFYDALNTADLSLMERIWVRNDSAKCVYPGWSMLSGWKEIKSSWQKIFEGKILAQVEISDVFIDVNGESAWVNCIERMKYIIDNQVIITLAQTTNIFEFSDSKWQIVLHHASPIPVPRSEVASEKLQ